MIAPSRNPAACLAASAGVEKLWMRWRAASRSAALPPKPGNKFPPHGPTKHQAASSLSAWTDTCIYHLWLCFLAPFCLLATVRLSRCDMLTGTQLQRAFQSVQADKLQEHRCHACRVWEGSHVSILWFQNLLACRQDAGFNFAFEAMRVKFKPTQSAMQKAEESGTDLAQALLKKLRQAEKQASSQAKTGTHTQPTLPYTKLFSCLFCVCSLLLLPPRVGSSSPRYSTLL